MGSFRLAAGTSHLHDTCIFAEYMVKTVSTPLCHSCGSELLFVIFGFRQSSDYTFILPTIRRRCFCVYFRAPKLFILHAILIMLQTPSYERCFCWCINLQTCTKHMKSCALEVCNGIHFFSFGKRNQKASFSIYKTSNIRVNLHRLFIFVVRADVFPD